MAYRYRIGDIRFGSREAKENWILEGVILKLNYIGKETKLSYTENELRKLCIQHLKKVIKSNK